MSADEATPKRRKEDRLPWFPFFVNDWDCDIRVRRMGHAARGMFLSLLLMQWREGSIPGDVLELIRLLHVPPDPIRSPTGPVEGEYQVDVEACLERVLLCFVSDGKGGLVNERLEEIRDGQDAYRKQQSELGRIGGLTRARNAGMQAKSKGALSDPCDSLEAKSKRTQPIQSQIQIQSQKIKDKGAAPDGLHANQYAAHICAELVIPQQGNILTVAGAIEALAKSRTSSTCEAHDYLLAKALTAKEAGETVNLFWFRDGKYNITKQVQNDHYKTAAQLRNERNAERIDRIFGEVDNAENLPGNVRQRTD